MKKKKSKKKKKSESLFWDEYVRAAVNYHSVLVLDIARMRDRCKSPYER